MVKEKKEYSEKNIKSYEGTEAIRLRSGMYVGVGEGALRQMVYEIISNCVDEALEGHCNKISIKLTKDGMIEISDNGRGIPWKDITVKGKNVPACVQAAMSLHAGGKFDTDSYATSGGTNGVGLTSVNALSDYFRLETRRDGKIHYFECSKGKITKPLTLLKDKPKTTGTTITFHPDKTILETVEFDELWIREMCKNAAYLNSNLKVSFQSEVSGDKVSFCFENGAVAFVNDHSTVLNKLETTKSLFSDPFVIEGNEGKVWVQIAFNYTTAGKSDIFSFVNGIKTPLGGTHETGFKLALTKVVGSYIEGSDSLKGKDKGLSITGEDCREGMVAFISVRLPEPKFHSQTKDELGSREAQGATQKLTGEFLKDLFQRDQAAAKVIAMRIIAAARGREAAKKAREVTRKNALGENMGLPVKLKDCSSNDPKECELFCVEGNSAGGSAETGRDNRTQAVLFLRGKVLNTYNKDLIEILKNEEIKSIIAALGTGVGPEFNIEKLRYHKIIIMADSDVDGKMAA
jgi:DNA gyrase subunit B